jgi:hypothetical protein
MAVLGPEGWVALGVCVLWFSRSLRSSTVQSGTDGTYAVFLLGSTLRGSMESNSSHSEVNEDEHQFQPRSGPGFRRRRVFPEIAPRARRYAF